MALQQLVAAGMVNQTPNTGFSSNGRVSCDALLFMLPSLRDHVVCCTICPSVRLRFFRDRKA